MATRKLHVDGATGKVVIYSGSDDVIADPSVDYSRVFFHSDLEYVSVTDVFTGTFSRPAVGGGVNTSHQIAAHGKAGIPFVFGKLTYAGVTLPFLGSVMLFINASGWHRAFHLGASPTHIVFHENSISSQPGVSFSYTVYVADRFFGDGAPVPVLSDETIFISPTEFRAARGKIDSARRYLRRTVQANADFNTTGGRTIFTTAESPPLPALRYSVNGYVRQATAGSGSTGRRILSNSAVTRPVALQ